MQEEKEKRRAKLIEFMFMETGRNMTMIEIAAALHIPISEVRRLIVKYNIFKNNKMRKKYDKSKCSSYVEVD